MTGVAGDRGVCFVALHSAHFHGKRLSGLGEYLDFSRKQRQKKIYANLSYHFLSHKQNFSQARVNLLFRVIHSKRLI